MQPHMQENAMALDKMKQQYQRLCKNKKGKMLDHLILVHGYNRKYASRLLCSRTTKHKEPEQRGRPAVYADIYPILKRIWTWYDYICGKRLAAILPEAILRLEACGELTLNDETRALLNALSARTIDRLLKQDRYALSPRCKARTRPGSFLKHQIPIKTFSEWNDAQPGYVAVDCVGHDGGCTHGDFNQTVNVTDIATGWTESRAVKNKAQVWVFQELKHIRTQFPFALKGLHSDNGGEFINSHLDHYCEHEKLTFTRGRPYRKNDNCYVEQKNWSVVRRAVGYGRYVNDEQPLNALYNELRLYTNFFMPVMKCIEKVRHGSRVTRRYDTPATPYQRVLASVHVSATEKARLQAIYPTLNPVAIKKKITRLQGLLDRKAEYNRKLVRSKIA